MNRPVVDLDGRDLVVTPVPGDPLVELKGLGAALGPGGRWRLPAASWLLASVIDLLPDAEVTTAVLESLRPIVADVSPHPRADDLYAFQRIGAGRLLAADGQMLCMSPGLGKTATSIVAADLTNAAHDGGILVVCPASLMRTWQREVARWSSWPRAQIAHGTAEPITPMRGWTITSYDTLVRHAKDWFHRARGKPWGIVILDESVLVKSHTTKRFKATKAIVTERRWLLSGSPITRYPDDLWTQLHLTHPRAFASYWRFAERYCHVEPNAWGPGKVVVGARRNRDAAADNGELIYVLNQKDALDLPEYLFEAVDVDLTRPQRKAYDDMLREFVTELDGVELSAENKVARLVRLQQIVSGYDESAKHDALVDLIADGVYEPPYIIWTHWRENAARLYSRLLRFGDFDLVQGGQTDADARIERYKAGDTQGLVLSMGVGRFGHTLTNTKTVFYVDKTWSADDYAQSLRRVRRIGLTHRPVVVTIRAPGTVDELVEANLEGKLGSIARMTNGDLREMLLGLGR